MSHHLTKYRPRVLAIFVAMSIVVLSPSRCAAQQAPVVDTGVRAYGSYVHGDFDHVNLSNGDVTIVEPFLSYPQKGNLSLGFAIRDNNRNWLVTKQIASNGGVSEKFSWQGTGAVITFDDDWQVSPNLSANSYEAVMPYFVTDPTGAVHPATGVRQQTGTYSSGLNTTIDGSGIQIVDSATGVSVLKRDGTTVSGLTLRNFPTPQNSYTATDVNGNTIVHSISYNASTYVTTDNGWTDSMGRVIPGGTFVGRKPLWFDQAGTANRPFVRWWVPGVATNTLTSCPSGTTSATSWSPPLPGGQSGKFTFCYGPVAIATSFNTLYNSCILLQSGGSGSGPSPPLNGLPDSETDFYNAEESINLQPPSLVTAPSPCEPTTQQADIQEDSESPSLLIAIILPPASAGVPSQKWLFSYNSYGEISEVVSPLGSTTTYSWITRANPCITDATTVIRSLSSRTVDANDGGGPRTWKYSYAYTTVTATDPSGNDSVHTFIPAGSGGCQFVESNATSYQGAAVSGSKLSSVSTTYVLYGGLDLSSGSALPSQVTTTLYGANPVSKQENFTYDTSTVGSLTETTAGELPVSFGNELTHSVMDFGATTPLVSTVSTQLWSTNPAYLTANLLDLPSSLKTLDASSNQAALITYTYDETAYGPGGVRGHVTSASHWNNLGASPTTHSGWNALGQHIYDIDPKGNANGNGHTIDFTYTDCGGNMLSGTANALGQTTSITHDCVSGLPTTFTDANSKVTRYQAYDAFGRIGSIAFPDNGLKTFTYNDVARTADIVTATGGAISPQTHMVFDGLGRILTNIQAYGTSIASEVDTTYDSLGRVYTVSNPHGGSVSPTDGITTYSYDATGRPLSNVLPDMNTLTWSYNGNVVTSTDEAQNTWARTSDALGRLKGVTEPSGLTTAYQYDALGNLKGTTQTGHPGVTPLGFSTNEVSQQRNFSYDSLSRLLSATNLESGTVSYAYLLNGALCAGDISLPCSKTNAGGVVMTYAYDKLNRTFSQTASDGSVAGVYGYDSTTTGTNEIGRLSSANVTGVDGVTFSYDTMGRVNSTMRFGPNSGGSQAGMAITYDWAGEPTLLTYPDGKQVTQTYDAAQRLAMVISGGVSYISGGSGTNISYTSSGAESSVTLGDGVTGVTQINQYNNRLQGCRTMVTSPVLPPVSNGGNILDRESYYHSPPPTNCGSETGNNGNLYSIIDILQSSQSQAFTYDSLNRLTSGVRLDNGYNHTYHFDSFGNLALQDNLHTNATWAVDGATNELLRNPTGGSRDQFGHLTNDFMYDLNGNMVSSGPAGHTYTYNALSQVAGVDGGATASYTYNALDERVYKAVGSAWTEYIYLNGQPMAEHNSAGTWTDYIYANGAKIAKIDSNGDSLHLSGTNLSGSVADLVPFTTLNGIVIAAGDTIRLKQWTSSENGEKGGIWLGFTNGDFSTSGRLGALEDQNGCLANEDCGATNQWNSRTINISMFAGLTINNFYLLDERTGAMGLFDFYFADLVLQRANGTIIPIWTGNLPIASLAPVVIGPGTATGVITTLSVPLGSTAGATGTHYFVDDHLGTAQMEFSGGGWPIWRAQFTPFGTELADGIADMHYKFTGKERDTESGLDYFGARYYASSMGRWMSPDWSAKEDPVPYAKLDNPQSLNLYSYVYNNPLSKADPDGHDTCGSSNGGVCDALRTPPPMSRTEKRVDAAIIGTAVVVVAGSELGVGAGLGALGRSMLLRFAPLAMGAGAALQNSRNAVSDALGKLSSAAASGEVNLSPGTAGRLQSATNAVAEHLTDSDITGALRQAADGALHGGDHLQEVQATANSLGNLSQSLTGALNNPNVQGQTRTLMQNAVNAMKPAIQQIKDLKKP